MPTTSRPHPGTPRWGGKMRTPRGVGIMPRHSPNVSGSASGSMSGRRKNLTLVKCLSLSLSHKPWVAGNILRRTCQPMTTKLLTLPSSVPRIPVKYTATVREECFLEMCSQRQGRWPFCWEKNLVSHVFQRCRRLRAWLEVSHSRGNQD